MQEPPVPPTRLAPGVVVLLVALLAPGLARAAPAVLAAGFAACQGAIAAASRAAGLPPGLLASVAVVESGRPDPGGGPDRAPAATMTRLLVRASVRIPPAVAAHAPTAQPPWRPWPWTINADGVGQFFATRAQAIAAVAALQAAGVRSIDVGCLQVNLRDHPHAFRSLDAAFDPAVNARYAAGFLDRLFARLHGWPAAVAAYHSQTPALGRPYQQLVFARWHAATVTPPTRAYADFLPRADKYADFARH